MQASVMNDLVPGFRFPEDFCGFPTTLCSCFHTPLDLSLLLLDFLRWKPLLSKCWEDVGSNAQVEFLRYIRLTVDPEKVGTRSTRLLMATLGRAFEIVGNDNGLSSCALRRWVN